MKQRIEDLEQKNAELSRGAQKNVETERLLEEIKTGRAILIMPTIITISV